MIITPNPKLKIREEAFMPVSKVKTTVNPTVGQMLKAVEKALGLPAVIMLPDTFVFNGHCNGCGKTIVYNRRKSKIWNHERWCEECRKDADYQSHLDHNNEWVTVQEVSDASEPEILQSKLRDLGIPKDDVLEAMVCTDGDFKTYHVRLEESAPKCKFSEPKPIESFHLGDDPADFYKGFDDAQEDIQTLAQVKEIFNNPDFHPHANPNGLTCYLSKQALSEFKDFAMKVYEEHGHEATGVIVGYCCSASDNPNHKITVGTNFIPAFGSATQVTCEISLKDGIRIAEYCDKHKVLPVCWIHSHPGFGAFFSGTDRTTLKTQYNAIYQTGVVVDILSNDSRAYRCINGMINESNYYVYDDQTVPPTLFSKRMKPVLKIVGKEEKKAEAKQTGKEKEKDGTNDNAPLQQGPSEPNHKRRFIKLLNGTLIINL